MFVRLEALIVALLAGVLHWRPRNFCSVDKDPATCHPLPSQPVPGLDLVTRRRYAAEQYSRDCILAVIIQHCCLKLTDNRLLGIAEYQILAVD
ncbi:hypothetical protein EDC04DRAFT_947216 [Pisolithus marmoratus]|nr:hypothetical protein EDC04DRAFT_947216 [Pisolithus marmoratus]